MSDLDGYILDLREYPKVMHMDMYGNGSHYWDQPKDDNDPFNVIFRAKYIRADLVAEKINEVQKEAFERGKKHAFAVARGK